MPSPLGHALGGIAVSWGADLLPGSRAWRAAPSRASLYRRAGGGLTLLCAGVAAAPDLDLFLMSSHRTATHSVTAVVIVTIVAAIVTGWVTGRFGGYTARVALMCGAACASHVLLDWLGIDRHPPFGIQMLWPFSATWFISGADLFAPTELHHPLSFSTVRIDLFAMASETVILLPLLLALWLVRVKTLARFSPQLTRGDHPAQQGARPVL